MFLIIFLWALSKGAHVQKSSPLSDGKAAPRRHFLKNSLLGGLGLAASTQLPGLFIPPSLGGTPTANESTPSSETLVAAFYQSLTNQQKQAIAFEFNHPLRSKVDNNWHITPQKIGEFYTADQQSMIREIFIGMHNQEYVEKILAHMQEDAGGLGNYSVAVFGEPGHNAFEFVLTGRHCTMRCDGDSVEGTAFGGPIFYGHASQSFNEKPDHPGNVYWYQAKRANEVFQALDGKQRTAALLGDPREEKGTATVELKPPKEKSPGLPVSEMSPDQKELVRQVLADLLLPFRKEDAREAMSDIEKNGGIDRLTMSFYKNLDIGSDGIWDVWQLESPTMIWYFRGAPHVHVWVNVRG
jgi:hypothetical protein